MKREAVGKYLREEYSDLTSILKGNCSCTENCLGMDVGVGKQGLNY